MFGGRIYQDISIPIESVYIYYFLRDFRWEAVFIASICEIVRISFYDGRRINRGFEVRD